MSFEREKTKHFLHLLDELSPKIVQIQNEMALSGLFRFPSFVIDLWTIESYPIYDSPDPLYAESDPDSDEEQRRHWAWMNRASRENCALTSTGRIVPLGRNLKKKEKCEKLSNENIYNPLCIGPDGVSAPLSCFSKATTSHVSASSWDNQVYYNEKDIGTALPRGVEEDRFFKNGENMRRIKFHEVNLKKRGTFRLSIKITTKDFTKEKSVALKNLLEHYKKEFAYLNVQDLVNLTKESQNRFLTRDGLEPEPNGSFCFEVYFTKFNRRDTKLIALKLFVETLSKEFNLMSVKEIAQLMYESHLRQIYYSLD